MPTGPGKYDDLCTLVREGAQAQGAVVIVLNGNRGSGFAVQHAGSALSTQVMADLLEHVVREMRKLDAQ